MATNKKVVTTPPANQADAKRIAFIRSVKLAGLGLDEVSASVDRNALAAIAGSGDSMTGEISMKQEVISHTEDHFVVVSKFKVTEKQAGIDAAVVTIKATYSAMFNLTKKASKEDVEAFAQLEAKLILFPYIRHLISDISYRMSINPIVLPMTSELENHS